MFLGIVFLIIGIVLLLQLLGIITGNIWGFFWALLLIVAGLKMMTGKKHHCFCNWTGCGYGEKMGPGHGPGPDKECHEHHEHHEHGEHQS